MKDKETRKRIAALAIAELGGVKKVNAIFPDVSQASISFWKIRGIPVDKERFLRAAYPSLSVWKDYFFQTPQQGR